MKLFKKLENLLSASAFAEEGEFETARTMAAEPIDPAPGRAPDGETNVGAPRIATSQLAPKT